MGEVRVLQRPRRQHLGAARAAAAELAAAELAANPAHWPSANFAGASSTNASPGGRAPRTPAIGGGRRLSGWRLAWAETPDSRDWWWPPVVWVAVGVG